MSKKADTLLEELLASRIHAVGFHCSDDDDGDPKKPPPPPPPDEPYDKPPPRGGIYT